MDEQQERTDGFDSFTGHPVDVKEDEFVRFSMIMARTFGALRMQLPTAVGFALYLLMTVVFVILEYQETGTVSWILIGIGVISLLCTLPGLVWIPKQTQRKARESYRANNDQEYYGEWTILDGVIIKKGGYKQWCVPLNESSVYIEDTDFMAFTSATDRQHVILFPARCMTEEMAAPMMDLIKEYDEAITPSIILIPTSKGSLGLGLERINQSVEKAIGMNILAGEATKH